MKPKILEDRIFAANNVKKDNLVSFNNTTGTELKDSNISIEEVLKLVRMTNDLVQHMANESGHVSAEDREKSLNDMIRVALESVLKI